MHLFSSSLSLPQPALHLPSLELLPHPSHYRTAPYHSSKIQVWGAGETLKIYEQQSVPDLFTVMSSTQPLTPPKRVWRRCMSQRIEVSWLTWLRAQRSQGHLAANQMLVNHQQILLSGIMCLLSPWKQNFWGCLSVCGLVWKNIYISLWEGIIGIQNVYPYLTLSTLLSGTVYNSLKKNIRCPYFSQMFLMAGCLSWPCSEDISIASVSHHQFSRGGLMGDLRLSWTVLVNFLCTLQIDRTCVLILHL